MQDVLIELLTLVHLDVDATPPDIALARLFEDDTLVLGAATGLLAREVDERTRRGDDSTLVSDGILVQLGRRSVTLQRELVHVKARMREVLDLLSDHCRTFPLAFRSQQEINRREENGIRKKREACVGRHV